MDGFSILGDPALNRVRLFATAANATGETTQIISYRDVLADNSEWRTRIAGRWLRLESPGRDFEIERALLARGARVGVEPSFTQVPRERIDELQRDPGLIHATRQWYLGFSDLLREIAATAEPNHARCLNAPDDVAVMFDKRECHARLVAAGVPVPRALNPPDSFDHLMEILRRSKSTRVFLKTSHGSGADGVLALEIHGDSLRGTTALEMMSVAGTARIYATKKLRVYHDRPTLQSLIDAMCRERLHVETWVPKAGLGGKTFDVRIVVIRGMACHLVLRLAPGPITNLHLHGAVKGGEALLTEAAGFAAVARVRETAERAAACFPRSLCVGVDVALTPSYQEARVLEVNAFGDLLEDVMWRGADTYTWAVRAALERDWPPS